VRCVFHTFSVVTSVFGAVFGVLLLAAGLISCQITSPLRCAADEDCPSGMRCLVERRVCVAPVVDAGLGDVDDDDATTPDAAIVDAASDAAALDAGDASINDVVSVDASPVDTSPVDASPVDASDAASVDASDAAIPPCDAGRLCARDVIAVAAPAVAPLEVVAPRLVVDDGGPFAAIASLIPAPGADGDAGATGVLQIAAVTSSPSTSPALEILRERPGRYSLEPLTAGHVVISDFIDLTLVTVPNIEVTETEDVSISLAARGAFPDEVPLASDLATTRAVIADVNGDGVNELCYGDKAGATTVVYDGFAKDDGGGLTAAAVTALALYCDGPGAQLWRPLLVGKEGGIELIRYFDALFPPLLVSCGVQVLSGAPGALLVADFLSGAPSPRALVAIFAEAQTRFALFTVDLGGGCDPGSPGYTLVPVGAEARSSAVLLGAPAVARRGSGSDVVVAMARDGTLLVVEEVGGALDLVEHAIVLNAPDTIEGGVVSADLDGDGDDEVIGVSRGGALFALRLNGDSFSGEWPLELASDRGFSTTPALGDLDGDPTTLEIVLLDDLGAVWIAQLALGDPTVELTWPAENGAAGATACLATRAAQ